MNTIAKFIAIMAISLFTNACTGSAAESAAPSLTEKQVQALDSLFAARYGSDTDSVPGGAVLIAIDGTPVYERYFGVADIVTGEKIDSLTRFNIASVSKQFTVAALLQQPGLGIDAPASDYFDYPQPFWHDVTLRHLASHSSGIPDSRDRSDRNRCVFADEEMSVAYFPTVDSLKFTPGEAYDYLNPSFILLAKVVEQESGMDFYDYVQKNIFDVAGMAHTYYFTPDAKPSHSAHGYVPDDSGNWREYDYGEETFFATRPDGGIYSTARDMLAWEKALASGKILPDSVIEQAYTPQVDVASSKWCDYQRRPGTSYGLGWFIEEHQATPKKVYHTGDNGGFQAYVAKYPEKKINVIVLENRNDQPRWHMATQIQQILLDY